MDQICLARDGDDELFPNFSPVDDSNMDISWADTCFSCSGCAKPWRPHSNPLGMRCGACPRSARNTLLIMSEDPFCFPWPSTSGSLCPPVRRRPSAALSAARLILRRLMKSCEAVRSLSVRVPSLRKSRWDMTLAAIHPALVAGRRF